MRHSRALLQAFLALLLVGYAVSPATAADGNVTWGVHVSLAPTWFDPAEAPGIITPYMIYYALHDALVKPMPGQPVTPSLAESWSVSKDGLVYEFVLRKGVKFHDGEPLTAEDVKFSFERYRGSANKTLKERVVAIETPDPSHVRFRLKAPWPDFLTFYTGASGAGWIEPKKYVEKVGDEGFKKAPVGAGPYKFVSFTPGVELVLEAYDQYWRKPPHVKRLVFKVIPDEATRLAALKRGEVDIVYSVRGELAEEIQRTPALNLKPTVIQAPFWLYFPDQWDAKSPWHDQRVRLAASLAIDRPTINQALTLGFSKVTGSIIPNNFEFFWQPPPPVFDPAKAKKLLADAGYPNGFDAGDYYCDASYSNLAEVVLNNLQAIGIRAQLRPLERAAFFKAYAKKKLKNIIQGASGAFGNAATRLEAFVITDGIYVYGSYPDLDGLFREQAAERDSKRREATLQKIQQLVHDKAVYAPIWQLAFINGVGSRVGESGLGLIAGHAYSAPYEDVTLKGK
ncbi:MAG: ABC transporter substrate-binding protein [Candidatus Rokubacteria bacterium]|nr:ABC transporter substrate-binding protein [Candidatus Rokubacteria bacterium]